MYERFYDLRERPFALSPDPEYLYPSRVHREALDYLRYGLESHAGFVVITGEIGSGKTTLLQSLLRNLDHHTSVARIVNTMLEPRELLETIMLDFGLDPAGRGKPLLLRDLAQYLVDQRLSGRMVLLVIDEAQNLSLAALEELRMLSNLETEKSKLMQVVLVGQPNLRDKLSTPELEQLRQRITVSYHLMPMDADETSNYINHRLRRAALGAPMEFPRQATDLIHLRSRGVPRVINVICDAALVFGYAEERRLIDRGLVGDVLGELETTGVLPATKEEAWLPPSAGSPRAAVATAVASAPAAVATPAPRMIAPPPAAMPAAEPAAAVAQKTMDARQWPSSPVRPRDDEARHAALTERERAIQQRERELAEQRRVLAEEYRLMRARHTAPSAAAAVPAARAVRVIPAPRVEPVRFESGRREGFWGWFRRVMLGGTHPAVEKN
jgi:putative secretion ATPase (PEP-CTERM system associated)